MPTLTPAGTVHVRYSEIESYYVVHVAERTGGDLSDGTIHVYLHLHYECLSVCL